MLVLVELGIGLLIIAVACSIFYMLRQAVKNDKKGE